MNIFNLFRKKPKDKEYGKNKEYCEKCGKKLVLANQKWIYIPRGYDPITGKKKAGFFVRDWICPELIGGRLDDYGLSKNHTSTSEFKDEVI